MILPSEYIGVRERSSYSQSLIMHRWSLVTSEVPISTLVFLTRSFKAIHSGFYSVGIISSMVFCTIDPPQAPLLYKTRTVFSSLNRISAAKRPEIPAPMITTS